MLYNDLKFLCDLYLKQSWPEQIRLCIKNWNPSFDSTFKQNARWSLYMHPNTLESPEARLYAFAMKPPDLQNNLFDELTKDFNDARNPFNMIITELRKNLVADFHDQSRLKDREATLDRIVEVCNKVTPSIATACVEFYKPIRDLLI
jgi:hypothetical protein